MNFTAILAGQIFPRVLQATALASVLIVLVALIQWAFGKRLGPNWRFALWSIVLIRLLLPASPETRFSIFNAPGWLMSETPQPEMKTGFVPLENWVPDFAPQSVERISSTEQLNPLAFPASQPTAPIQWLKIIALIWALGTFCLLLRLLIGTLWLRCRLGTAHSTDDPKLTAVLRQSAADLNTRCHLRIVETTLVSSPALFGLFTAKLLVPPAFAAHLTESELRHIFLHELAHLKRRDLLTNWLMAIAQAIHWFNPLVWLAFRQMRLDRELACDEIALRVITNSSPGENRAYGQTILRLLEGITPRRTLPGLVGIAEEKHCARQRIARIAAFSGKRPPVAAPGIILFLAIALCGLTNAQLPKEDSPAESKESAAETQQEPAKVEIESIEKDDPFKAQRNFFEKLSAVTIQNLNLGGKSLSEALEAVHAQLPKGLQHLTFNWRYTTNIIGGPGIFSANAYGYIELPLAQSPATGLKLAREFIISAPVGFVERKTLQIKSAPFLHVLGLLTQGTEKELAYHLEGSKITLYEKPKDRGQEAEARLPVSVLINDARLLVEMGQLDVAEARLNTALKFAPEHRAATYYLNLIAERRARNLKDRNRSLPDSMVLTNQLNTNSLRSLLLQRLKVTDLENFSWREGSELKEVIFQLYAQANRNVSNRDRLHFIIEEQNSPNINGPQIDPRTGLRITASTLLENWQLEASPAMKTGSALEVLQAITRTAHDPKDPTARLTYLIEDFAVVFKKARVESEPLYTKHFRLNPKLLSSVLGPAKESVGPGWDESSGLGLMSKIQLKVREWLENEAGIDFLSPPIVDTDAGEIPFPQKAFFYSDRTGVLMLRCTLAEIDRVENALEKLEAKQAEKSK